MQIFYDSRTEAAPVVIDGTPPTDQSSQVASLQAQVTQLTADLATRTQERDDRQTAITAMKAAAQADKDADDAREAGQGVLDAAGSF